MDLLNSHLANHRYVTGETFTMGDIPLGCALARWLNLPVERPAHAHLDAYYQRLQHRDAYRQWVNVLPLT